MQDFIKRKSVNHLLYKANVFTLIKIIINSVS